MSEFAIRSVQELQRLVPDWARPAIDLLSLLGGPAGWMVIIVLTFWWSGSRLGTRVVLLTCVAALTNVYLKWWFVAPRPIFVTDAVTPLAVSDGLGMPSGHAHGAATQWGALAWWGRAGWLWPVSILMILAAGLCRIYYGLHTPSQVLAGWMLGATAVAVGVLVEGRLRHGFERLRLVPMATGLVTAGLALVGIGLLIEARISPGAIPTGWEDRFLAAQESLGGEGEFRPIDRSDLAGAVGALLGALAVLAHYRRSQSFEAVGLRQRLWVTSVGVVTLFPCVWAVRLLNPLLGDWGNLVLVPGVLWMLVVVVPRMADRLDSG